jgi:hypothetical protein
VRSACAANLGRCTTTSSGHTNHSHTQSLRQHIALQVYRFYSVWCTNTCCAAHVVVQRTVAYLIKIRTAVFSVTCCSDHSRLALSVVDRHMPPPPHGIHETPHTTHLREACCCCLLSLLVMCLLLLVYKHCDTAGSSCTAQHQTGLHCGYHSVDDQHSCNSQEVTSQKNADCSKHVVVVV